jgi:rhodanese-related sulfurtransferase
MAGALDREHFQGTPPRGAKAAIREISADELSKSPRKKGVLLLDVREDGEWRQGHLPRATHLRLAAIDAEIRNVAPSSKTPIVCYCAGGFRSAAAAATLKKLGYADVYSLAGGIRAWTAAGLPTVKPAA